MGNGSLESPFTDLKTAIENPKLTNGHTIYLKAGTHVLRGAATLATAGVTVCPYQNAEVTIDLQGKNLDTTGAGIVLRDVTITSGIQDRESAQTGSAPADIAIGAFDVRQPATLTNVRIAGVSSIGWWTGGVGVWRGVLAQGCGWDAPDRGHGHALYTQNRASDGTKTLQACILVNGFGWSLHIYGSRNAFLSGYALTDCIIMNERALIGGEAGSVVNAVTLTNCALYAPLQMGFAVSSNEAASITDCLLRTLTIQQAWQNLTVSGCTVLAGSGACVSMYAAADYSGIHADYNVYISDNAAPFELHGGGGSLTFAQWQAATGLDAHSRHYTTIAAAVSAGDLTAPVVRVYPVDEGRHVANIAIWNPLEDATASVDLSALGMANGSYELRQVRDYTGDVRAVQYTGQPITVAMSGTTEWPPGYPTAYHPEAVPTNALPVFGAFELWTV